KLRHSHSHSHSHYSHPISIHLIEAWYVPSSYQTRPALSSLLPSPPTNRRKEILSRATRSPPFVSCSHHSRLLLILLLLSPPFVLIRFGHCKETPRAPETFVVNFLSSPPSLIRRMLEE
ncbi:hypothetical protein CH063_12227, partial [Colletotrichum higginsianum]